MKRLVSLINDSANLNIKESYGSKVCMRLSSESSFEVNQMDLTVTELTSIRDQLNAYLNGKQKAIIVDCDQVLVDHTTAFRGYVNEIRGTSVEGHPNEWSYIDWLGLENLEEANALVGAFSKTPLFGALPAMAGAQQAIQDLSLDGYKIICVTACGDHHMTTVLRRTNLYNLFGNAISEIHFTTLDHGKADIINEICERYDVLTFIDDNPLHIEEAVGIDNPILMKAPHNRKWRSNNTTVQTAYDWHKCVQIIKGLQNEN